MMPYNTSNVDPKPWNYTRPRPDMWFAGGYWWTEVL
jgi:hypothetical protein